MNGSAIGIRVIQPSMHRGNGPGGRISLDGEMELARQSRRLALVYSVVAFTTHALFISASLMPGLRGLPLLDGDSSRYLRVATNVVRHGAISIDAEAPFRWDADRPPGYPLLIALSLKVTGDERWTLYAAALSAAGAAWAAVTLVGLWGGSRLNAHIAGGLVALLPNSLGLSAMLLTDAIFGHCMLLWVCLLYQSLKALRPGTVAGSVLVLAFLQTLRPQLLIFAPGLVVLAVVLLGERSRRTAVASVMLVGSLLVPAYLTFRVYRDHGVVTPSMVGARTAREYLQVRFLAEQEHSEFVIVRDRVRGEDHASAQRLSTPESLMARRYLVTRAQVAPFVRSHPVDVARLMFTEATRQLLAPQEFAVTVLTSSGRRGQGRRGHSDVTALAVRLRGLLRLTRQTNGALRPRDHRLLPCDRIALAHGWWTPSIPGGYDRAAGNGSWRGLPDRSTDPTPGSSGAPEPWRAPGSGRPLRTP